MTSMKSETASRKESDMRVRVLDSESSRDVIKEMSEGSTVGDLISVMKGEHVDPAQYRVACHGTPREPDRRLTDGETLTITQAKIDGADKTV